jgi:hypothetical protein
LPMNYTEDVAKFRDSLNGPGPLAIGGRRS